MEIASFIVGVVGTLTAIAAIVIAKRDARIADDKLEFLMAAASKDQAPTVDHPRFADRATIVTEMLRALRHATQLTVDQLVNSTTFGIPGSALQRYSTLTELGIDQKVRLLGPFRATTLVVPV